MHEDAGRGLADGKRRVDLVFCSFKVADDQVISAVEKQPVSGANPTQSEIEALQFLARRSCLLLVLWPARTRRS